MKDTAEWFQALVSGERRGPGAALLRRLLWLAAVPYGLGVRLRNRRFDRGRASVKRAPEGVPVVSVGNLTLGGTGKTPCVEYVAGFYARQGRRVAILSRGYGAEAGRNDEAMLLEENLPDVPHLQGPDRATLAETAVEELESEVLVLDDGFQHRRLARDLDVVLIDATNPWGYGSLFPRGMLRESPRSLRRADVVMLTRADRLTPEGRRALVEEVRRYAPELPVVMTKHQPTELVGTDGRTEPLEALKGRPVAAFCGIGNPEAFRHTLSDLGANPVAFRTFPDHHAYTREDVEDLRRWAAEQPADAVIATTQKDFVKIRLPDLSGRPLWAVRVGLAFLEGQDLFDQKLLSAECGVRNAE